MKHEVVANRRVAKGLWVVVIPVAAAIALWPNGFALDDTYITLSNARTLLGQALDPFGTSYLVGATSAVHLVLVAAFGLILPLELAALAVSLVAIALYARALELLAERSGLTTWRGRLVSVIGLLWGLTLIQLMNGLETGMAMATVAWLLVLADNRRLLPILCGLAPFIRPELVFLAGPLLLRLAWIERDVRRIARLLLVAGFAGLPWAIWYFWQTGAPLPTTGSAKIAFFAEYLWRWPSKLSFAVQATFAAFLPPLLLGFLGYRRVSAGWCAGAFVLGWLALATVTLPGSLFWNDSRYAAPLIPALLYGVVGLATERSKASDVFLGLLTAGALVTGIVATQRWVAGNEKIEHNRRAGQAIAGLPSDAVVLVHDAGWSGWSRPKAKLVDVVGLKTPGTQRWHRAYTRRECQWDRALDAIAHQSRATHLVTLEDGGFWSCTRTNLERAGWKVRPVFYDPGFYGIYQLTAPQSYTDTARTRGN